jgi:hypothetical protein
MATIDALPITAAKMMNKAVRLLITGSPILLAQLEPRPVPNLEVRYRCHGKRCVSWVLTADSPRTRENVTPALILAAVRSIGDSCCSNLDIDSRSSCEASCIGWSSGEQDDGDRTYAHAGGSVGGATLLLLVPEHDLVVAGVVNISGPAARIVQRVAQVFEDHLEALE